MITILRISSVWFNLVVLLSYFVFFAMGCKHILIDLIIINYKSTDFLFTCLNSVYNNLNGINANVHVIDNDSRDHINTVKSNFQEISLTINDKNLGFAKAVNNIIRITSSPYIVLLNPDTIILDGFFDSIFSYIDKYPDVGILGPKIIDPDGSIQGSARAFPNFRSAFFGRTSFLTRIFPNSSKTCSNIISFKSDGLTPLNVDWVSGACQVIRRDALKSVGLFDERFFLYWEDVDLCKRLKMSGWKIIYFPIATIKHNVGGSSEQNLLRSIFEFHRSANIYFMKYLKSNHLYVRPLISLGISLRFLGVLGLHAIRYLISRVKRISRSSITSSQI